MTHLNLFPRDVRILRGNPREIKGDMYPAEQALVSKACPGRRREFRAGRILARALMYEAGIEGFPLLMGDKREPLWPQMICGSITHLPDVCVVAIAEKTKVFGLGLDVARVLDVGREIWPTFLTPEELQWVDSLPPTVAQRYAAMLFSAKETLFKCLYPVTRVWIDFKDVRISTDKAYRRFRRGRFTHVVEEDEGAGGDLQFEAEFKVEKGDAIPRGFKIGGTYQFDGPYVFTGMTLSRRQAPQPRVPLPDAAPSGDVPL